jgi:biofilm PGA synthesis lipoprotein PgaB
VGQLTPEWGVAGYKNEVIVLMYHEFLTTPIPGDDITPADFAAQLALFHQDGYHVITLSRFIAFVNGQATVPPNALLLTFDNGYLSQYTDAFPLLKKYGYPATLFLIGSWLTPGYAPAGLQTLTSADVKTMVASGLISIGTQGWNVHTGVAVGPNTTEAADIGRAYNPATGKQESLASYDQAVEADLLHAQRALTPYAHAPLQAFAYPFGDYRPRLIRLLHSAGFHYLFAAKLGWGNLQGQSADVLYRLNVGAEGTTPLGALSAIRTVAHDTAGDPAWQPPPSMIEVWHG